MARVARQTGQEQDVIAVCAIRIVLTTPRFSIARGGQVSEEEMKNEF